MPRIVTRNLGAPQGGYDPARRPADFEGARAAFVAGTDTPRALLERGLEVIALREAELRAFAHLDIAGARAAADASAARYRAGRPLSALDGCPLGIKDTLAVRGMPGEMNSTVFRGHVDTLDAACVMALRAAGGVILGKTQVPELTIGRAPPTRNPFDATRTAGASSSGSGASVGAGMVPVAIGNQTGGSLIRPSSFNGIYGFKPSWGALNVAGMHAIAPSQDHIGPMAASLADAWRTAWEISARAGGHNGHPGLTGTPEPPRAVRPRRLAWLRTQGWAELDAATREGFTRALAAMEQAGVGIIEAGSDGAMAEVERLLLAADRISNDIITYEARWPYAAWMAAHGEGALGEAVRARIAHGLAMTPADYRRALAERDAIRAAIAAIGAGVDGFITLASSGPAPVDGAAGDQAGAHMKTGSRSFLSPWSMVGGPSLSLPILVVDGMPVGVQLMGLPDRDAALCATAAWIDGLFSG
ncbi:amidase [Roseococcus sp. SDR]|uniref:amidase n=1 Tax=Roseococcus sp. SDR TaxID=2835532 RepID=UPI001BCC8B7C|nr:amidase [Roseococcus sp. SDR]MBS7792711.1 amidase [Roseococcus sp. SDR]MBV1848025.1 amidase [Roseococcus sp. SDR]